MNWAVEVGAVRRKDCWFRIIAGFGLLGSVCLVLLRV